MKIRNVLLLVFTLTLVGYLFFFSPTKGMAIIVIDDYMTRDDRDKTGISKLNQNQVIELENWLNKNFMPKSKEDKNKANSGELTLSENMNNGQQIKLSDGSVYEVDPRDITLSALWITPFPVTISPTDDPDYPFELINKNSMSNVRAKQITPPGGRMMPAMPTTPSPTPMMQAPAMQPQQ